MIFLKSLEIIAKKSNIIDGHTDEAVAKLISLIEQGDALKISENRFSLLTYQYVIWLWLMLNPNYVYLMINPNENKKKVQKWPELDQVIFQYLIKDYKTLIKLIT